MDLHPGFDIQVIWMAEGTGIYFSPLDPNTLYVNVQHSQADDGDATWAITRTGRGHWKKFDY